MSAFILTNPTTAPQDGGTPGIIIQNVIVKNVNEAPNNITVVDKASDTNAAIKWMYTIIDDTNQKVMTAEVNANNTFNTTIRHNRHSMIGDLLRHTVDVVFLAGEIGLEITNLTVFDFRVNIMRIEIPA